MNQQSAGKSMIVAKANMKLLEVGQDKWKTILKLIHVKEDVEVIEDAESSEGVVS